MLEAKARKPTRALTRGGVIQGVGAVVSVLAVPVGVVRECTQSTGLGEGERGRREAEAKQQRAPSSRPSIRSNPRAFTRPKLTTHPSTTHTPHSHSAQGEDGTWSRRVWPVKAAQLALFLKKNSSQPLE